ncbi:MAG: hypothetical protein GXY43_00420 [Clostridiaceae bacterium]|nr:hypothetical protein [Clostridiaceae bacterium]
MDRCAPFAGILGFSGGSDPGKTAESRPFTGIFGFSDGRILTGTSLRDSGRIDHFVSVPKKVRFARGFGA